jgi:hypothetical protein
MASMQRIPQKLMAYITFSMVTIAKLGMNPKTHRTCFRPMVSTCPNTKNTKDRSCPLILLCNPKTIAVNVSAALRMLKDASKDLLTETLMHFLTWPVKPKATGVDYPNLLCNQLKNENELFKL